MPNEVNAEKHNLTSIMEKMISETILGNGYSQALLCQLHDHAFRQFPKGAFLLDEQGTIIKINNKGIEILGLDQESLVRFHDEPHHFYRVFDIFYRELGVNEWPSSLLKNGITFIDSKYIFRNKKNGKEHLLKYSGTPFSDENGVFLGGMLYFEEIGPQHEPATPAFVGTDKVLTYDEQLELFERQLKEDRQLLQTVINTIPVMVTIYDDRLHSIILNNAVEEITGWNNKDLGSANIMELAYPDPKYRTEVMEFMASLDPGFMDIVMRTKDGRDIETSWANVELPDGRQVGVGIDISERKKLMNDLIIAREKAEKENQVQYAFIQNISHEVRTPMNSILGFTELLQDRIKGKKETDFLQAIAYNGKHLLRLIDDIIDFSRLDKNEMSLNKKNISINYLMEQTKKQVLGLKKSYNKQVLNLILKNDLQSDKDVELYTDPLRLQQILTNLVSNALKYTEKGEVEVSFKIREKSKDLLFAVKDTGIGIKEEDYPRVFLRFNQLHASGKKEFRGTGLGLAICKHLVQLLGGEIWFVSQPGVGSQFFFTHPFVKHLDKEIQQPAAQHEINVGLPKLQGKNIMIVEDDRFSFLMMQQMLVETKAKIFHAENGLEALRKLESNPVDLVFLDIRLPELDGYQVFEWIKNNYPKTVVVAQTANAMHEDREKIERAGFHFYISKPISKNTLYGILNRFLVI